MGKEVGGGHEEQRPGHSRGEVEDSIGRAWWGPDEHVLEHLLDESRIGRIADEVGAELTALEAAEGHVVAQDLALGAVGIGDGVQRDV